uniref:AN1-type zinc finger protein 1-like n=1 Tax=Sinocyclocheilus grahami TaxID=75366 RepID=A0A672S429_SINGR
STKEIGSGGSKSYPCSYEDCKGKELLPVICPHCEKHFCLTYKTSYNHHLIVLHFILYSQAQLVHRHQDDHKCEKLEIPKPRMAATQELVQKIVESKKNAPPSKGRKGAKNAATII